MNNNIESKYGVTIKPHILFFSNHLRGPKGSAGARSWHQVKAISEKNYITVIIPSVDPVSSQPVTEETFEGLNENAKIIRIKTTKNNRNSKISRTVFYLSAMLSQIKYGLRTKDIDLVLSMSLPITLLATATLISKVRKVPLIIDVRDLPFETASELGYIKSELFIKFLKKIENYCLRQAVNVVTNSPRYIPYLEKFGVSKNKIILAPIGYDDFPPPSSELVEKWRNKINMLFPVKPKHLTMYAGTIGFAFPVDEILKGAKLLSNDSSIGFIFVGDGQRLEEFEEFAEKNNINAVFLGRVTKQDTHAICRVTDVCLYPAKQGKFSAAILGNKIFDYLGAEKPIIYIGPDSAVADVITELKAGIICSNGEPEYFVKSLTKILGSNDVYNTFVNGTKEFRAAGYTAPQSAQKLLKIINDNLSPSV